MLQGIQFSGISVGFLIIIYCNITFLYNCFLSLYSAKTTKRDTDDSPPFELSQNHETLSQLPKVDLGDDFNWDDCSHVDTDEKENKKQSANVKSVHEENKLKTKKCVTLKEWSKGHVSDLKVNICSWIQL